ncbi:hypothetical protein F4803DRAFT_514748 [Xylaria telfairii]|nr:hypothetical protein F4803DRAFT_514748 [Xylaria telfairii]
MTTSKASLTCALPPFLSLVRRSIEAWESIPLPLALAPEEKTLATSMLERFTKLDNFLCRGPVMYWFFQKREAFLSQKTISKWSSDRLDDYILLPSLKGYVTRSECFFLSHFWQKKDDPDPDGTYLRLNQQSLRLQSWSYIWVDWTCIPQHPRTEQEDIYFKRALNTMSGIIRNSGFIWYYPPFQPRLWILYEIAENDLTSDGDTLITPDNKEFKAHIQEMMDVGVRPTIDKYGYSCSYDRDKEYLISWLELLVLLRKLCVDTIDIRRILDGITWSHPRKMFTKTLTSLIIVCPYEGTLEFFGKRHTFTPLPER